MDGQYQNQDQNNNSANQNQPQQNNVKNVSNGKGFSTAALILGILGIVGAWIPVVSFFTGFLALLGLIFGAIGRKRSTAADGKPSGIATAGLVLGIIGTVFAVIGVICSVACAAAICSAATGTV